MPSKALADFQSGVDRKLQDDDASTRRISTTERDAFIAEAVARYSRDKPRLVVADVAGGASFNLSLPSSPADAAWEKGFSSMQSVEYPYASTNQTPRLLDRRSWTILDTPSGQVLRFLTNTPQSGETVRLTYTVRHTLSASLNTIPDAHADAVTSLAASFYAKALAAIFAASREPSLAADSVDYRSKAAEYTRLADKLEADYKEALGVGGDDGGGGSVAPAGATSNWDVDLSPGLDRIVHRRVHR